MKTETKERITNENARITAENVQHIGEYAKRASS